jgi:hypothetical protein
MKERPILFRPEMVRAISRGQKRQTRRPLGKRKLHCVGDRLWVRETWNVLNGKAIYRADNGPKPAKWRPSIFMPRKHCRMLLAVVEVRVELLVEISEADALEEGFVRQDDVSARQAFLTYWAELHEVPGGWTALDRHEEVVAYTFNRVDS